MNKALLIAAIVAILALILGVLVGPLYSGVFTYSGVVGAREDDPVLVGAGDIARCDSVDDERTANLLDSIDGTVVTLGDNAYDTGSLEEFDDCYEPTWGRHKARTYPVPGNAEYETTNAAGYFDYFGPTAGDPSKGYYSYNLGGWHIVALNSMCETVGGCGADSPMVLWLKEDLDANPNMCTLAYWHHPLFSSGGRHGNDPRIKPVWDALYAANAEVVLTGHDHDYERFAPQDPNGVADTASGISEFVVGTDGAALRPFGDIKDNSEARSADTHGILKLTLHGTSYDWEFIPVRDGAFTDSGSGSCH